MLTILVMVSATALAWDDCPHGEADCPSPGDCAGYIDTDDDEICDHSQSAPEDRSNSVVVPPEEEIHDLINGKDLKTKTVNEIAELYQINSNELVRKISEYLKTNVRPKDSFQLLHDNYGLEPSVAKDIAVSIKTGQPVATPEEGNIKKGRVYHLLPISLSLILLYIVSHVLSKRNIISIVNHRKIWNALLLVTFLISGILGVLLVIRINFSAVIPLPFNILFWHVEVGIAMMVISMFHILWHWAYFKNLFMIKK